MATPVTFTRTIQRFATALTLSVGTATCAMAAEAPKTASADATVATVAAAAATTETAPAADIVKIDDNSLQCMRKMLPVRHFYVANLLSNKVGTRAAGLALCRINQSTAPQKCGAQNVFL